MSWGLFWVCTWNVFCLGTLQIWYRNTLLWELLFSGNWSTNRDSEASYATIQATNPLVWVGGWEGRKASQSACALSLKSKNLRLRLGPLQTDHFDKGLAGLAFSVLQLFSHRQWSAIISLKLVRVARRNIGGWVRFDICSFRLLILSECDQCDDCRAGLNYTRSLRPRKNYDRRKEKRLGVSSLS